MTLQNRIRNEQQTAGGLTGPQDTIRPTVFIGLGSTGAKIVSRLKAQIDDEGDKSLANEFLSYLIITSEVSPEPGVDRNIDSYVFSSQGLTGRAAVEAFTKHEGGNKEQVRNSFRQWWSFDEHGDPWIPPVNDAGIGAGGIRSLGRLLLHMRCMDYPLVDRIQQEQEAFRLKKESLEPHLRHLVNEQSVSIYVFGLLAGGTCSGSVADVSLLIRTALPQAMIHGVFLLGDVCHAGSNKHDADPRKVSAQKKNTEHALAELTLLQTEEGRRIALRNWVRRIGQIHLPEETFDTKPFFKIALVGAANDHGYKLKDFSEYIEFVARFHAMIYTTEAYQEQIGRSVDEQSQNVTSWDSDFPARPNNFVRLGLMNIEIPKDRVLTLARHKISQSLATEAFKHVDQDRCEASKSRFLNEIQWSRLDVDFLPDARSFLPELEARPKKRDEFSEAWGAAKADADRYLESWYAPDATNARKRIDSFLARLDHALEVVIDDFLGQAEDRPVSFGSLEHLLSSLVETVNKQIAINAEQRLELEEALFTQGGLSNRFDATLAEHVDNYPSRLKRMIMPRFIGNHDLADLLEDYQKKGRAYCGFVMLDRALMVFRNRLLALSVARKLITGDACVRPFFAEIEQEREVASRVESNQIGMRQSVLERTSDLENVFVLPLLTEKVGVDSNLTRREVARSFVLQNWRGEEGGSLANSFRKLLAHIYPGQTNRNANALTVDQALAEDAILDQLITLAGGLRAAFDSAEERILRPVIAQTSVWEGVRRYLQLQRGANADITLKGLFTGYANRASFFPRLTSKSRTQSFEPARYNYCICRTDDARAAFEQLRLPHPETYIDTLFTHAFGYSPRAISKSNSSSYALSILRLIEGELPTHYEGYEDLSKILSIRSEEEAGEAKQRKTWSDWRFPDWIREWHRRGGHEYLVTEEAIYRPLPASRRVREASTTAVT